MLRNIGVEKLLQLDSPGGIMHKFFEGVAVVFVLGMLAVLAWEPFPQYRAVVMSAKYAIAPVVVPAFKRITQDPIATACIGVVIVGALVFLLAHLFIRPDAKPTSSIPKR